MRADRAEQRTSDTTINQRAGLENKTPDPAVSPLANLVGPKLALAATGFAAPENLASTALRESKISVTDSVAKTSWLSRIKEAIRYYYYLYKANPIDKPTGLELLSTNELVDRAQRAGAFAFSRRGVFLEANWSGMLRPGFLMNRDAKNFRSYLRQILGNSNLVELGVGAKLKDHQSIFRREFKVRNYRGVDQQDLVLAEGGIKSDMLKFLATQPNNSVNIVAFGVFNEPLCMCHSWFSLPARTVKAAGSAHYENEYLKRLARELYRVTPAGGIFFGDGIHDMGKYEIVKNYLLRAGFVDDQQGYQEIAKVALADKYLNDPFFLRKPATYSA